MRILALALLLLPACATGSYLWYRIAPDYPESEDDTFVLDGLSAPVTIYLDEIGVAHIDAETELDLFRAFGFMHGRDRFFQLDMMRRVAQGRVSELVGEQPMFGSTTVGFDRTMHGWGLHEAAKSDAERFKIPGRANLAAYVDGVNAALREWLPLEYRLLRVEPEPWTMADTFALGRLQAWSVSHNWQQEAARLVLALHGGWERAEAIYPGATWPGPATLPPDEVDTPLPPAVAPELHDLFPPRPPPTEPNHGQRAEVPPPLDGGSNGWVVGGEHSRSGKPVVANDPHLSLTLPALFAQVHLRAPGVDVIGMASPGVPMVVTGHNQRVAWTITSAMGDLINLFVEKPAEAPGHVLGPDGPYPLEEREVVVRVLTEDGVEERHLTMRFSRHGPLFNDMYPGVLPDWAPPVALQWASGDSTESFAALASAARSTTAEECVNAMGGMAIPVSTWMAADLDGKLAFSVNGDLPVRRHHRGTFPAPGWLAKYDWDGLVEAASALTATAGPDGHFVHANNLVRAPEHSRALLHVDSAPSHRFERIEQLLTAKEKHDVDSFRRMQVDIRLPRAEMLNPHLLADLEGLSDPSATENRARELLAAWDFEAPVESTATAIFFSTYREAIVYALEDEVDADGLEFVMAQRYSTNAMDLWFSEREHVVWDDRRTPAIETRTDVVRSGFRAAIAWLTETLGPDVDAWRWGSLRTFQLKHPFGGREALAELVNLPAHEAPGAIDSVWKANFVFSDPSHPFRVVGGPVVRLAVDLADIEHGAWVSSTGTSAWPGSPHYGDQHGAWIRGELFPMVSNWDEIRASAKAVLSLEPPTD